MDADTKEAIDNVDSKSLIHVRPGTFCTLVGINPNRHPRKRRHMHRWHGKMKKRQHSFGMKLRHRVIMARLLDLGLTKGCVFQVIQSASQGPVLLEIRGTRIALGHGLASMVLVREVPARE